MFNCYCPAFLTFDIQYYHGIILMFQREISIIQRVKIGNNWKKTETAKEITKLLEYVISTYAMLP